MENLPSISQSKPEEITAVGLDNLPSSKKPKKTILLASLGLFFVLVSTGLAIWLVGQRQQLRKEAEEPAEPSPPFILQSEAGSGQWKNFKFDGYPGCQSASESKCEKVQPYPTDDGWTSSNYTPDSNWKAGFILEEPQSSWWYDFGWECSKVGNLTSTKIIGPIEGKIEDGDRIFPDINAITGLYRREFEVQKSDKIVKSVSLNIFSDNKVIVYLNNNIVYQDREQCGSANIDPQYLQTGKNVLAIQLSNDSVSKFNNPLGLAYKLRVNFDYLPTLTCENVSIKNSAGQAVTEIEVGETVTITSSGLAEQGGIWYAQIPTSATRCAEGDCQKLTNIASPSVSQTFTPTEPGKYVFETNVFDNNCERLCSSGQHLYDNGRPGDCENGQWQNKVDCRPGNSDDPRCLRCQNGAQCQKYLIVKEADAPASLTCGGLSIKNASGQEVTEITLGKPIVVTASGLAEQGGIWYAQIPTSATRCAEGDCQKLTNIASPSVSQTFTPTETGKYVFETDVFDNECKQLCSTGQHSYENGVPGNCEADQWQNRLDCREGYGNEDNPRCLSCQNGERCREYLMVLDEEAPLACLNFTKNINQPEYGDAPLVTCQASPTEKIDHFNFRWQVDNSAYAYHCNVKPTTTQPTKAELTLPPIINYGRWHVQCQVCSKSATTSCIDAENDVNCTAWGEAQ